MKKYISIILLAATLLVGCGDDKNEEAERERARAEQAEQARKEAEDARKEAEEARKLEEQRKSTWQTVASVVGIGAVVLLVFGTAIGSSARRDAEKRKGENNE